MASGMATASYELRFDSGRICWTSSRPPTQRTSDSVDRLRAWITRSGLVPRGPRSRRPTSPGSWAFANYVAMSPNWSAVSWTRGPPTPRSPASTPPRSPPRPPGPYAPTTARCGADCTPGPAARVARRHRPRRPRAAHRPGGAREPQTVRGGHLPIVYLDTSGGGGDGGVPARCAETGSGWPGMAPGSPRPRVNRV